MAPEGIYARYSPYLERHVQLGFASSRVLSLSFPEEDPDAAGEHDLLDRIEEYLDGVTEDEFADVEVALTVPTEERSVLQTVRELPYGENVTVEQLTSMTPSLDPDDEVAQNVVRNALAGNPTPLLIPDHRVRDGPSAAPAAVEQKLRSLEGL
jgi:methylated-DNA-[protein]-cysteine S-methyltransferase